jgi:hypothetical protein
MAEFPKVQQEFLYEMLRLCGLADSLNDPECALCHAKLDSAGQAHDASHEGNTPIPDRRILRCQECGEFLQCKNCCLERHSMMPLHFLKVRPLYLHSCRYCANDPPGMERQVLGPSDFEVAWACVPARPPRRAMCRPRTGDPFDGGARFDRCTRDSLPALWM